MGDGVGVAGGASKAGNTAARRSAQTGASSLVQGGKASSMRVPVRSVFHWCAWSVGVVVGWFGGVN